MLDEASAATRATLDEQLVLAAPPKFLGQLRSSLDAPSAKLLIGSIDKELASSDEAEILQQIGKVVLI